jgi:hypothetical protein
MSLPACRHMLTREKYKEMTTSRKGSLSSATPKKQKTKKWQLAREAHRHLLHLKNAKDDDELGVSWFIIIS